MTGRVRGRVFYPLAGAIAMLVTIAGFALEIGRREAGFATLSPLLVLHAALFLGWYALFIAQALLAGRGMLVLHRRLGWASIGLAIALAIVGFQVIASAYHRPGWTVGGLPPQGSAMFALGDLAAFCVVWAMGLINRRNPPAHKRLMLLAGIAMIDPGASRLLFGIGLDAPLVLAIEFLFFASLAIHDAALRRSPHWASLFAIALFAMMLSWKFSIAPGEGAAHLATALFG